MSEDPQFYRNAITARFMEFADSLHGDFPLELVADLKKAYVEILEKQFRDGRWSAIEREKLIAFIERMLGRQGTIPTDFESLYNRKAELDRKMFESDR